METGLEDERRDGNKIGRREKRGKQDWKREEKSERSLSERNDWCKIGKRHVKEVSMGGEQ